MTSMTPYKASQIANLALEASGVQKKLPPQMFYNYTNARIKQGKKALIAVDSEGRITESGLSEWLEKYIAKQLGKEVTSVEEEFGIPADV